MPGLCKKNTSAMLEGPKMVFFFVALESHHFLLVLRVCGDSVAMSAHKARAWNPKSCGCSFIFVHLGMTYEQERESADSRAPRGGLCFPQAVLFISVPEFTNFKLFGKTILVVNLKFRLFLGHPLRQ